MFEQLEKLERQTEVMDAQRELMSAQTVFMESQTARLDEQTRQAEMQNEIMTLNLVGQLREQILSTVETFSPARSPDDLWLTSEVDPTAAFISKYAPNDACEIEFNKTLELATPASLSTILAIQDLARSSLLSEQVVEALEFLVRDSDSSVALSAVLILDRLGKPVYAQDVTLAGVLVKEFELQQAHDLSFDQSIISNFLCPNCSIEATRSIVLESTGFVSGWGNLHSMHSDAIESWLDFLNKSPFTSSIELGFGLGDESLVSSTAKFLGTLPVYGDYDFGAFLTDGYNPDSGRAFSVFEGQCADVEAALEGHVGLQLRR